jgi:hypothetical protein
MRHALLPSPSQAASLKPTDRFISSLRKRVPVPCSELENGRGQKNLDTGWIPF